MNKLFDPTSAHNKQTALKFHEKGTEVTPTEIVETRKEYLAKLRESLPEKGIPVLQDDEQFLKYLSGINQLDSRVDLIIRLSKLIVPQSNRKMSFNGIWEECRDCSEQEIQGKIKEEVTLMKEKLREERISQEELDQMSNDEMRDSLIRLWAKELTKKLFEDNEG